MNSEHAPHKIITSLVIVMAQSAFSSYLYLRSYTLASQEGPALDFVGLPSPPFPKSWIFWCRSPLSSHKTLTLSTIVSPTFTAYLPAEEALKYLLKLMGSTAFLLSSLFATAVAASD
jgi:hypothetical protein